MRLTKRTRAIALLLAAPLLGTVSTFAHPAGTGEKGDGRKAAAPDRDLVARVDRHVKDWQPVRDERRFDEIGWARDIRDARRLARSHNRPVFLFTYDGADMACFRC
jgi:hypothetical protein